MELEYTQDDIDAFVQGSMSSEARKIFALTMKENPALADAVADAQFAHDVGAELLKRDLRKMMHAWDEEKKTPPHPRQRLPPSTAAGGC